MKCIVALCAVLAVASAGLVAPTVYSGYSALGYSGAYPYAGVYGAHAYAAPWAHAYASHAYATPLAHAYATPVAYSAPVARAYTAPIASGYVAQTPGSLHVAPHPEGPFTASHHINTAPAPGTY